MTEADIVSHFIARRTATATEAKRQTETAALGCFAEFANRATKNLYLDAGRHPKLDTRPLNGGELQDRQDLEMVELVPRAAQPPLNNLGLSECVFGPAVFIAFRLRVFEVAFAPDKRGTA